MGGGESVHSPMFRFQDLSETVLMDCVSQFCFFFFFSSPLELESMVRVDWKWVFFFSQVEFWSGLESGIFFP